jgi:hypothetical protein
MSQFEIVSDSHTVHVVDYETDQKYVFSNRDSKITGLRRIVHSTASISLTAPTYDDVEIQDTPDDLVEFLESKGYSVADFEF